MNIYDVIIVGGGCAGFPAALYTSRRSLKTLVLSKDLGGQISTASVVENYPGIDEIGGLDLANKFKAQAEKFGTEFSFDTVEKLTKDGENFKVKTIQKEYQAKTVILAFGKTPRNLKVPGEKEFTGKGVVYCATCDGPLFKGKDIAIIGGGNTAFSALDYMSHLANKIYLVHRNEDFKAETVLIEKAKKDKNVEFVLNSKVLEIQGKDFLEGIKVENLKEKKQSELKVQGVFVEIGFVVDANFVQGLVDLDEFNQIIVNSKCETKTPGLFAAGDVTTTPYKQAVISAGMGATAGLSVNSYLSAKHGKTVKNLDWGNY
ncbi:thioredoxin-disulfide reductase [Patescibacteria group bacterium]